jgi:vacuolar-type H+-ATPase subunit I/STV1
MTENDRSLDLKYWIVLALSIGTFAYLAGFLFLYLEYETMGNAGVVTGHILFQGGWLPVFLFRE